LQKQGHVNYDTWGQFHQHVYKQLLQVQIPKAQKRKSIHQCLFVLLGSARVKSAHEMLVKSTPDPRSRLRKSPQITRDGIIKNLKTLTDPVNLYHLFVTNQFIKISGSIFYVKLNFNLQIQSNSVITITVITNSRL
jgi:hypothetical protein